MRWSTLVIVFVGCGLVGVLLGAGVNAINVVVSPSYFEIIGLVRGAQYQLVHAPAVAVVNGVLDGMYFGLAFGLALAVTAAA